MVPPEVFIVAGPPGAGKSSVFPLPIFTERNFNADDRAAELNGGSYRGIPFPIRERVNREFEDFVHDNIAAGRSFALETTLRSHATFEQANLAQSSRFKVFMIYVALDTFKLSIAARVASMKFVFSITPASSGSRDWCWRSGKRASSACQASSPRGSKLR